MTELQKNFIEKNMDLCSESIDEQTSVTESTSPGTYSHLSSMMSTSDPNVLSTSPNTPFKFEPMIVEESYSTIQSCLGTNDIELSQPAKQMLTCIFCQENSEVKLNSEALVLSAYVQKFVYFFYRITIFQYYYSSLVQEFFQKIVRDVLKIGIHLIQHLCPMIFIGVYMFHHVVMLFMHLVGQSELSSLSGIQYGVE